MPRLGGPGPNASDDDYDTHWFRCLISPEGNSRRGICIATTSALETMLADILDVECKLNQHYYELLKNSLGDPKRFNFDRKIRGALVIGLFSEHEAARCHIMREIRNEFAHNKDANFLLHPVEGMAKQLFDIRLHGPKPDAFWIYCVGIEQVLMKLRKRMRDLGLVHNA
jgi:hypothetical protein